MKIYRAGLLFPDGLSSTELESVFAGLHGRGLRVRTDSDGTEIRFRVSAENRDAATREAIDEFEYIGVTSRNKTVTPEEIKK